MNRESLNRLYRSLAERWRPEDVAFLVKYSDADISLRRILTPVVPRWYRESSMPKEFSKAQDLSRQLTVAKELFPTVEGVPAGEERSATELAEYAVRLTDFLVAGRAPKNFAARPMRSARRREKLPYRSHRAFNKRLRFVMRLKEKLAARARVAEQTGLFRIAKTRLASELSFDEFTKDGEATAILVAYLTSRLGLRSTFTAGRQARAYDEVADQLLGFAQRSGKVGWYAIAHVLPVKEVLDRCSETQRGIMLGRWYEIMERCCHLAEPLLNDPVYNLQTLVVKKGNDSSTWNELAGAFNKARDGWLNTVYALGATDLLDTVLPGKWLRLMAADVVFMHKRHGSGDLDPDTKIWNDLPKPWQAIFGGVPCNLKMIEKVARKHGVEGRGWTAPRAKTVASFTPTPELVHGVVVTSPALASILRRSGYFSARNIKEVTAPIVKTFDDETKLTIVSLLSDLRGGDDEEEEFD